MTPIGKAGWPVRSRHTWLREMRHCRRRWRIAGNAGCAPRDRGRKWQSRPTVASGLAEPSGRCWNRAACSNAQGKIHAQLSQQSKRWTRRRNSSRRSCWNAIYDVPKGDITIEHIQHAFYMAANYGFQILNGNFAAAIDDYELKQRFMNDLATYRIDVSWLWTLVRHQAVITKDGFFQRLGADRRWVVLAPAPRRSRPGPASPRNCSRRCGIITTNGPPSSLPNWTGAAIRGASTAAKRQSLWSC